MAYDNTNSGALFKNDKQGNENWADYKGSININGAEFWVSAWIKQGKSGKFMSLAVKPKDAAAKTASTPQPSPDADIPF
jgi:hypothetical protein